MARNAPRHAAGIASLTVQKADPKFLQDLLALKFALTRRAAKAIIDGRSVWVNRKCVWIARYAVKTGDVVEVPQSVVKAAQGQAKAGGSRRAVADGRQDAANAGRFRETMAASAKMPLVSLRFIGITSLSSQIVTVL